MYHVIDIFLCILKFHFLNNFRVKERTLFSRAIRLMLMEYVKPVKGLLHDQKEKLFKLVEIENEDRSLISFLGEYKKRREIFCQWYLEGSNKGFCLPLSILQFPATQWGFFCFSEQGICKERMHLTEWWAFTKITNSGSCHF